MSHTIIVVYLGKIAESGEALQAIVELDLDEIAAVQLPRGYGRD